MKKSPALSSHCPNCGAPASREAEGYYACDSDDWSQSTLCGYACEIDRLEAKVQDLEYEILRLVHDKVTKG